MYHTHAHDSTSCLSPSSSPYAPIRPLPNYLCSLPCPSLPLQYYWLREDLCTINRRKTPWVVAFMHVPLYSTNREHYVEVCV